MQFNDIVNLCPEEIACLTCFYFDYMGIFFTFSGLSYGEKTNHDKLNANVDHGAGARESKLDPIDS